MRVICVLVSCLVAMTGCTSPMTRTGSAAASAMVTGSDGSGTASPTVSPAAKADLTGPVATEVPPQPSALVGPDPKGGIDPYIAKLMRAVNDWGLACADKQYYFIAGSTLRTGAGLLYLSVYTISTGRSSGPQFRPAPAGAGQLRLTGANCASLSLTGTDGSQFRYDLITGQFSRR